jgi:hypothetical protein
LYTILLEVVMLRFRLLLWLGAALLAAGGCAQRPETPLTQAAVRNDVAALRQLLDDGHKADEGGDSWTALIWASRSGSIEAINLLLDSGADVNLPGSTGDNWDATPRNTRFSSGSLPPSGFFLIVAPT